MPAQIFCIALWGGLLAAAIILRPPLPMDETRYLAVAWEMWLRDDFLVPYLNGEPYDHKPPLLFWLMQAGWKLFGVNDWSPRLVAPMFALGSLFMTWVLAKRLWPEQAEVAAIAPLLLMGSVFWALFGTLTMFDMLLTLFAIIAAWGLVFAWQEDAARGFFIVGLAIGGGVLAKGPAILLHILPAAFMAPLWAPRVMPSRRTEPLSWAAWYGGVAIAVLIGAAIGLAWALPAAAAGGEAYAQKIFWGQSAGRVVNAFDHARPWWWYLAVFPPLIMTWLAWPRAWRAVRGARRQFTGDGGLRLMAIWVAVPFVVFSIISGKQLHYLLPEFPPLALALAALLTADGAPAGEGRLLESSRDSSWDSRGPALLFGVLGSALGLFFLLDLAPSWATTAEAAHALPALLILVGAAVLAKWPRATASGQASAIAALSAVTVLAVHLSAAPVLRDAYDVRDFASRLKALEDGGYRFAFIGEYHGTFQFLGRLTHPIRGNDGGRIVNIWLDETRHPKLITYRTKGWLLDEGLMDDHEKYRSGHFIVLDGHRNRHTPANWHRK